eukprot:g76008.t1
MRLNGHRFVQDHNSRAGYLLEDRAELSDSGGQCFSKTGKGSEADAEVAKAKLAEIQGLYDAGCLEWKALYGSPQAGRRWYNHISRTSTNSFPPPFVNDVREEQHDNLVRRLQEARFRLTDKGDVEVFCGMQFESRIVVATKKTCRLCVYMHREPDVAYGMVSRIYRSLRDQRGIFFQSNVDWRTIDLQTYADADLGKCKFTRRSRSGELQYITGPVFWSSRRQSTVALSTQESETIAMSAAARNTVAIQNFCSELGIPISQPSTVYGDNQGSILTTTNGFELERKGRITSRKIGTTENLAVFSGKHSRLHNI